MPTSSKIIPFNEKNAKKFLKFIFVLRREPALYFSNHLLFCLELYVHHKQILISYFFVCIGQSLRKIIILFSYFFIDLIFLLINIKFTILAKKNFLKCNPFATFILGALNIFLWFFCNTLFFVRFSFWIRFDILFIVFVFIQLLFFFIFGSLII